jgi:hypothetical protein
MKRLPAWLERFNRSAVRNQWRKTAWEPLAAAEVYNESRVDSFFYESDGKSIAFPHRNHIAADSSTYFENLLVTPFADELVLIAAESLLVAEQLGKDRSVDLLSVSLSAADYIGHSTGPNSKEIQDYYLRLDRTLDSFIRFLDQAVGKEQWLMVLTSDHGVLPLPEYLPALNMEGRRVMSGLYESNIKRLITTDPELQSMGIAGMPIKFSGLDILLDPRWIGGKWKGSQDELHAKIARAVSRSVDVEAVFTRAELMSPQSTGKPYEELIRNSFDSRLAADLLVITKPGVLVSSSSFGTSHLTPHDYDRKVPIVFFGSGVCARKIGEIAYTVDIVPTLVEMLGLKTKAPFDGRSRAAVVRCR